MKKILLLISLTFLTIACKKQWDCQCTYSYGIVEHFDIKDTKVNAQNQCWAKSKQGYVDTTFYTYQCDIVKK